MKNIRSHSVFFGLALAGIFVLIIFSYLTQRPLKVENAAEDALMKFYHYNRNLTIGTFIIFFILLFVSSIMYIRSRYWDTFIWTGLIFATFTLVDWWWLSDLAFLYRKEHNSLPGESNLYPLVGVLIALAGIGITIGNFLLLKKMVKEKHIPMAEDTNTKGTDTNSKSDNHKINLPK